MGQECLLFWLGVGRWQLEKAEVQKPQSAQTSEERNITFFSSVDEQSKLAFCRLTAPPGAVSLSEKWA